MIEYPSQFISQYPEILKKYSDTVEHYSVRRKFRRAVLRNTIICYFVLALMAFIPVYLIDIYILDNKNAAAGKSINATTYVAAIGVLVGGFQIWLLSMASQASAMKDFIGKIFEKPEFYSAWRDLFYNYPNRTFQEIDDYVRTADVNQMGALEQVNLGRELGSRLWHPRLIQGEPEEGRIDNLLGYLNIIGDYYDRGLLSLSEIGDATEYYLLGIANSEAFLSYLDLIAQGFSDFTKYESGLGPSGNRVRYGYPPFRQLCFLLYHLDQRRKSREDTIYDLLYYRRRTVARVK